FFGDAAHMRSDHHAGRTWGKRGETPIVETTGARHRMSLISAICSLGVDPKLMHALVWHQSGGEPWSFSVPGEREPRVYRKLRDALREANALHTDRPIRVGLAGLVTNASAVTETTFLPCPNIAAAPTRSISTLRGRFTVRLRPHLLRHRSLSRVLGAPRHGLRTGCSGNRCEYRRTEFRHAEGNRDRGPRRLAGHADRRPNAFSLAAGTPVRR
ncbi:MAG: hypothetical protein WAK69_07565, partial [Rhodoplanes sp.]